MDTLETFSNASDFVMALANIALEDSAVSGHHCQDKLIRVLVGLVSFSVSKTGWPGQRITDVIHETTRHCPQVRRGNRARQQTCASDPLRESPA